MDSKLFVIILAAGKGTRINSKDIPKNMYPINGKPMIGYFIETLNQIKPEKTLVIVGYQGEKVVDYLKGQKYHFAWQKEQLGTAHAVTQAKNELANQSGITIVCNGDNPFFKSRTYINLAYQLIAQKAEMAILSVELPEEFIYGRLDIDATGHVKRIIEVKNATTDELKIKQMNAGLYAFDNHWLWKNIVKVKKDEISNEYYLTDLVNIANQNGDRIIAVSLKDKNEAIGINTMENLRFAEKNIA